MTIWATLGLDGATNDAVAVRRAYARRLKAINADAEPAAFIALRDAYDEARQIVALSEQTMPAPVHDREPTFPATPPTDGNSAPATDDGACFRRLDALLFPVADDMPAPDPAELAAALQAVLDHPDMARIQAGAEIELWLAHQLYAAIPRGDAMLDHVIAHFHWETNLGRWDNVRLFDELVRRRDARDWIAQVTVLGHPLHAAWEDLTGNEETISVRARDLKPRVEEVLATIRRNFPGVESLLSPRRVSLWHGAIYGSREGGPSLRGCFLVLGGVFLALMLIGYLTGVIRTGDSAGSQTVDGARE